MAALTHLEFIQSTRHADGALEIARPAAGRLRRTKVVAVRTAEINFNETTNVALT